MQKPGTAMSTTTEDPDPVRRDPDRRGHRRLRYSFSLPCFRSRRPAGWWERVREAEIENPWWIAAVKKLREWSELIAGPNLKTFLRRFNRTSRTGSGGRNEKFHYDPLSYALNFDRGQNGNFDEDGDGQNGNFRDFSTRYASVSGPPNAESPVML